MYLCVRDAAGNVRDHGAGNTVVLDRAGPSAPVLSQVDLSDVAVELEWSLPSDADLTSFVLERRRVLLAWRANRCVPCRLLRPHGEKVLSPPSEPRLAEARAEAAQGPSGRVLGDLVHRSQGGHTSPLQSLRR